MGKLPFIGVQCDLSLSAPLQKLSDVISVLGCVTVVNDNIVDDATVARESGEGFVHPAVVMLGNGRNSVRSIKVLESPKWCYECG